MALIISALLALSFPAIALQDSEASQEIPPLTNEDIISNILFELDDIVEEDIEILEIKQLEDQARVNMKIRGDSHVINFICRKTDFGPKWKVNENLAEILVQKIPDERTLPSQTSLAREEVEDPIQTITTETGMESIEETAKAQGYKDLLDRLITVAKNRQKEEYPRFYFLDGDFDYSKARTTQEKALERVNNQRKRFIKRCEELESRLSQYQELSIVSYFTGSVPEFALLMAKEIMPGTVVYYSTVSVEINVDGQLGKITFEGVTLLPGGWRIGMISNIDIP